MLQREGDYIPLVRPTTSFAAAFVPSTELDGTERSSPFEAATELEAKTRAATSSLSIAGAGAIVKAQPRGYEGDDVDATEAWILEQMRKGGHRRTATSLPGEHGGRGPAPAAQRALPAFKQKDDTAAGRANGASSGPKPLTPGQAMAMLWETVEKIEGGVEARTKQSAELEEQRAGAQDHLNEIEKEERGMDKLLRSAQELDGLAWGLGGLLDEKLARLRRAIQTLGQMEQEVGSKRRRRRIRCLADDMVHGGGASISKPTPALEADKDDDPQALARLRTRRVTRRERRCAAVGATRCADRAAAEEGWATSSGSEEDGAEEWREDRAALCAAAHKQILGDVSKEFSSFTAVLSPLKAAKKHLLSDYEKAFVPMSLPEMLSLHVEHSLLWWDPLELCATHTGAALWGPQAPVVGTQLESFDWFSDLAAFTELRGEDDPDGELVPQLVRRSIFPEVTRRLRECWDVTSARQTSRAVALIDECLLFDSDQSGESLAELFAAAKQRLETGLAEHAPEVFVAAASLQRWYASSARQRLMWRACKIARCALMLDERLPDVALRELVLGGVFATRLAPHLRAPRLDVGEMALLDRFVGLLPRRWLDGGLPPVLAPLRDALGPHAPTGPQAAATAEAAARVLYNLRCFDEAQVLSDGVKR